MNTISKIYFKFLVLWATLLLIWGIAGFFEFFTEITPFIPLQNSNYPAGVQFVHWLLISSTGILFLIGYFTKWKWTPIACITLFTNLATLCTIETIDFGSENWGYTEYLSELSFYLITALFLLYSKVSKSYFKIEKA